MEFTYDLNQNGCLIITAADEDRNALRELPTDRPEVYREYDALEHLLANSDLSWIRPEEIGALTSAPIIGFRDGNSKPTAAWGFMDYALRSFVDDLIETGKAVFVS